MVAAVRVKIKRTLVKFQDLTGRKYSEYPVERSTRRTVSEGNHSKLRLKSELKMNRAVRDSCN